MRIREVKGQDHTQSCQNSNPNLPSEARILSPPLLARELLPVEGPQIEHNGVAASSSTLLLHPDKGIHIKTQLHFPSGSICPGMKTSKQSLGPIKPLADQLSSGWPLWSPQFLASSIHKPALQSDYWGLVCTFLLRSISPPCPLT